MKNLEPKELLQAKELEFIIKDEEGEELIHKIIKFPYIIDGEMLDREIGMIFIRECDRKEIQ